MSPSRKQEGKKRKPDIIVLSSDDENETDSRNSSKAVKEPARTVSAPSSKKRRATSSSPLEINQTIKKVEMVLPSRLQMEAERLARQRQGGSTATTSAQIRTTTTTPRFMSFGELQPTSSEEQARPSSSSDRASSSSQRFWKGEIKRTTNRFDPASGGLSFADVVGPKGELERALVSAMQLNPVWVAGHFPANIPLILLTNDGRCSQIEGKPDNVKVIHPPKSDNMGPYPGVYHIKAFFVSFSSF
jgi:hypothetical protein